MDEIIFLSSNIGETFCFEASVAGDVGEVNRIKFQ